MIRTRDWKCVRYSATEHGQLFDLRSDPNEENDLWAEAECADVRRELLDQVAEWRASSHVRAQAWAEDFR